MSEQDVDAGLERIRKVEDALARVGAVIDRELDALDYDAACDLISRLADDVQDRADEVFGGEDATPPDLDLQEGE